MRSAAAIPSRVLLAALFALPVAASAQWAVFDSSNFGRNALTASQTASMYAQQLSDSGVRVQQLMTMFQNLKQLPPASVAQAIDRNLLNEVIVQGGGNPNSGDAWGGLSRDELIKASGQTLDVYRSNARFMNQSKALYEKAANWSWEMEKFSAASGMSPQEILTYEVQQAQAGRAIANAKYQEAVNMQRQLGYYKQQADQALQQAAGAEGAVQALGAVALQNQTMSDQLSSLIAASARREELDAARLARESQDEERRRRLEAEARRATETMDIKR